MINVLCRTLRSQCFHSFQFSLLSVAWDSTLWELYRLFCQRSARYIAICDFHSEVFLLTPIRDDPAEDKMLPHFQVASCSRTLNASLFKTPMCRTFWLVCRCHPQSVPTCLGIQLAKSTLLRDVFVPLYFVAKCITFNPDRTSHRLRRRFESPPECHLAFESIYIFRYRKKKLLLSE